MPDHASPRRRAYVCEALLLLNRYDEALSDVDTLLAGEGLSTEERVTLTAVTVYALSIAKRFEQCAPYARSLQGLLPHEDPLIMGRALSNLAQLAFMQGDFLQAEETYKELVRTYGKLEPGPLRTLMETKARISAYMLGWEIHGILEEALAGQLEALEKGGLDQQANVVIRQNAAVNLAIVWDVEAACRTLRESLAYAAPYQRLMIQAMLAFLELDVDAFQPSSRPLGAGNNSS